MRAGRLNRRITLQSRTTTQDAAGQPVETWSDVANIWADIRNPSGLSFASETIKAGVEASTVRLSVRTRYREDIDPGMRLVIGATNHDIVATIPDHAGRQYLDIICERVQ